MFYTHIYNNKYLPAAPFVQVTIYSLNRPKMGLSIALLVDSGTDGTLLPKKIIKAIRARFLETRMMGGITGPRVQVRAYLVSIEIGGYVIHGIRAAALEDDQEPILGRDVLNQLIVTLNGLGETIEIRD